MSTFVSRTLAVAAATVVLGLFAVGSRAWYGSDAFTLRAGFQDVRGVEIGARVRVQGIDAGEVVRVEPPDQPGGSVVLHLRMRGEYRRLINTASYARIVSEGLLGGRFVEIVPGPNQPGVDLVSDNATLRTVCRDSAAP